MHRVPVETALKAMTIWPAWQHFEENHKGSITPGKLADFVILSGNPLTVPEDRIEELVVLATIKEDETIYERPEQAASRVSPALFGITLHDDEPHRQLVPGAEHVHGDGCFNPGLTVLYHAITGSTPH